MLVQRAERSRIGIVPLCCFVQYDLAAYRIAPFDHHIAKIDSSRLEIRSEGKRLL